MRMAKARLRRNSVLLDVADRLRERADEYERKGYASLSAGLRLEVAQLEQLDRQGSSARPQPIY